MSRIRSIVVWYLLLLPGSSIANGLDTYHDPVHRERLQLLKRRAEGQGPNRNGLEQLRQYNILSDSLFADESSDTVDAYEQQYDLFASGRLQELNRINATVRKAELDRTAAKSRFFSLFQKSLYALAVWLVLVVIVFRSRRRNVKTAAANVQHVQKEVEGAAIDYQSGQASVERFHQLSNDFHPIAAKCAGALTSVRSELAQPAAASDKEFLATLQRLENGWLQEDAILEHLSAFGQSDPAEKVVCNMNDLCDRFLEIAYRGNCLSTETITDCRVTRDFERNMQPIAVFPESAGSALLEVFDNAFRAVLTRAKREEKGYQPTVSVSTRILPRFVQVRIKDNGDGMNDAVREKAMDAFYSARQEGKGAGIGLSEAKRILTELHNGEVILESDPGRGTDVYLKFYR